MSRETLDLSRRLAQAEKRILDLERRGEQHVNVAIGGGIGILVVDSFPAIPASARIIHHTPSQQLWAAGPDSSSWAPLERFTSYTGAPDV